ncbi:hypothetical protein L2750_17425 [Shewanella submarina]|uniref:Uncharacterized protein n=1 Tax=Shewanella submarina TaxID=2016376 RepID=A0ABV7GBQ2_9GAMM|nr:hypothetical protein [Shewanella submarina]MCL1038913.1 hypothetical protein [Shewanella submarina]
MLSLFARVYNGNRTTLLFLGPAIVFVGFFTLLFPEDISTYVNGVEVTGSEEREFSIYVILIGIGLSVFRFVFMRYRKLDNFQNDIPLPTKVDFEVTDDVNENIRRYKAAQKKAVEEIRKR